MNAQQTSGGCGRHSPGITATYRSIHHAGQRGKIDKRRKQAAGWRTLNGWGDRLWEELIGILGWQDVLLRPWTYFVLTIFLMLMPFQKLQLPATTRARVMVITGFTALGYVMLVYLIFFLTYTPLDIDHVRGVQGRYFVVALPVASIFVAAVINLELPNGISSVIATTGGMISGIATVEALLQAHW